jgi:rhodanese-related sulfurtransferase
MKSARELVTQASSRIKTVSAQEAREMLNDPDTVFVDLRDSSELQRDGKIPGGVHVNRGMLEFVLDPTLVSQSRVFFRQEGAFLLCKRRAVRTGG